MICDNISVNEKGHLTFAGRDTVELAQKYGTPLYLMDEEKIREHIDHLELNIDDEIWPLPKYRELLFTK